MRLYSYWRRVCELPGASQSHQHGQSANSVLQLQRLLWVRRHDSSNNAAIGATAPNKNQEERDDKEGRHAIGVRCDSEYGRRRSTTSRALSFAFSTDAITSILRGW